MVHSRRRSVPPDLSFEHGALVEPLAVALHGIDIGEASPASRCVVIGAGPIGVMTALAQRARGSDQVLVIEKNEQRQRRMQELASMQSGSTTCTFRCWSASAASCPTLSTSAPGNPAAPQLAIELVRSRGIIVLMGVLEEPVEISQLVLIIKEAQLRASFAYRRDDFDQAVALLAERRLPADR